MKPAAHARPLSCGQIPATSLSSVGTMSTPEIRPYTLHIPDTELADLRRRLEQTRWPDERPDAGWSDGLPLNHAQELAEYWRTGFDWRAQETRLNGTPQFLTKIQSEDIHFFHLRSSHADATPLLLVHGWPSGPTDFLGLAPLLTEPDDGPAFHLVIPTIPGFGVPGPINGWTLSRAAGAFAELMSRLGYSRFAAHGYDTGAGVVRDLGLQYPDRVVGVHTTGMLGGEGLTEKTADMSDPEEARAVADGYRYTYDIGAYAMLQSTRPQSLAYALTDSPVGLMSWLVERFHDWSRIGGGPDEVLDRDEVLTVVSLYWFFRTAGSSARYYKYGLPDWSEPLAPSTAPTGILVMPDDIGRPVRRLAEKSDRVLRWSVADRGGHFAAWEQPHVVADDLRAFFANLG